MAEDVDARLAFKNCCGASNTRVRLLCVREKELRSNSDLKFTAEKKKKSLLKNTFWGSKTGLHKVKRNNSTLFQN